MWQIWIHMHLIRSLLLLSFSHGSLSPSLSLSSSPSPSTASTCSLKWETEPNLILVKLIFTRWLPAFLLPRGIFNLRHAEKMEWKMNEGNKNNNKPFTLSVAWTRNNSQFKFKEFNCIDGSLPMQNNGISKCQFTSKVSITI